MQDNHPIISFKMSNSHIWQTKHSTMFMKSKVNVASKFWKRVHMSQLLTRRRALMVVSVIHDNDIVNDKQILVSLVPNTRRN